MNEFSLLMFGFAGLLVVSMLRQIYRHMGQHDPRFGFLLGPVAGFGAGTFLWFWINSSSRVNGVGLLERQSPPLDRWYLVAAIGAAMALLAAVFGWLKHRRTERQVSLVAGQIDGQFSANVERHDARDYGFRLFTNWHRGMNRVRGELRGVPFDMFDYTSEHRSGSGEDRNTVYRTQTVVVLPCDVEAGCPRFQVAPRHWLTGALQAVVSSELITVGREGEFLGPDEQRLLRRWNEYYLVNAEPGEAETLAERIAHPVFMRRLVAERRWSIESDGRSLLFWKANRVVPADDRQTFLEMCCELRDAMKPARAARPMFQLVPQRSKVALLGGCGLVVGAVFGMFGSFAAIMVVMFADLENTFGRYLFAWPVLGLASTVACAYVGSKVARRFA